MMQSVKIDELRKLQQKKYREQFGCFLAEGEHLVLELQKAALTQPALRASELYLTEAFADWDSTLARHVVSERVMQQISETRTPQGIVARVPISALAESRPLDGVRRAVYLYETQDPGNLGSILRTLAWFGGFECLLSPGCVDPFNGKVVRSSMGAVFHVPIQTDVALQAVLDRYRHIACLDMAGDSLPSADFHQADCLVFGNEARGLPAQLLQQTGVKAYTIPGSSQIDSLNLASALAVCAYELMR